MSRVKSREYLSRIHPNWPRLARVGAVALLLVLALALARSYRDQQGGFFRRPAGSTPAPRLSQRIVSSSEGVHRFDLHGDKARFLLNAARDDVFDDGHHEMSDVTLEIYGAVGITQGQVKAAFAVYDPSRAAVTFEQGVQATTSDGLSLRTERLVYDGNTQVISTGSPVEFARASMSGFAVGAEIATRRGSEQVTLLSQVRLTIEPKAVEPAPPRLQPIHGRCGRVLYRLDEAIVHCSGEVIFNQSGEELSARRMEAHFDLDHRLRRLMAFDNASLVSRLEDRISDVRSEHMEFDLDESQRLSMAVASGGARAHRRGAGQDAELTAERIEVRFAPLGSTPTQIVPSLFTGRGGRVAVRLRAAERPAAGAAYGRGAQAISSPSEKLLTANSVELSYRGDRHLLEAARAQGDAVLVLTPLLVNAASDRKTIRAQSMELRFFEDGNLARSFHARDGVRVEFEPMTSEGGRSSRVTMSQELEGEIDRQSQEFTELEQRGRFRFVEGERNALSERATYSSATQVIRLSGGEPVVWDALSRTRAKAIELDGEVGESRAAGNVITTYYDRKSTGQAVPFLERGSPVFVAGEDLKVHHRSALAVYTGGARAWQDDSYVSGDRIELHRQRQMMLASGHVRSAFYRAASGGTPPVAEASKRAAAPAYATAQRMTYLDADRLVRYEGDAQLRQDLERISSDRITAYLNRDRAELDRAVAEGHVSITEPGRRAYGDSAHYRADSRTVTLQGRNARVEDERQGVTRGPQLTFILGDGRVAAGDDRGSRPVKSTRKVE
ncbi:MAG: LPS export ABC transporter periplasmic protein LptC [Acidobacteria bacterium]|nr:LPS export ABC transporter periplasmic protein LptC [Acidobacteriota bacterium]